MLAKCKAFSLAVRGVTVYPGTAFRLRSIALPWAMENRGLSAHSLIRVEWVTLVVLPSFASS